MDISENPAELTFLQKIVLLALDDRGWFGSAEHKMRFGLVGAILFELYKKGRIAFRNDEVIITNAKMTGDVILDRVLNFIKADEKQRTARSWIQRITYKKLLLRKTILKQLIQLKVIGREEFSLMIIFSQTKYPLIDAELKKELQKEISEKLLSESIPSDYDLMLYVVMNNCNMVKKNFKTLPQFSKIQIKINQITQFKNAQSEADEIPKMLNAAIARVIMASTLSIQV